MKSNSNNLFAAALLAAFVSAPLQALELTPDAYSFRGKAGQKLEQAFTVKNDSAEPRKIAMEYQPQAGFESQGAWLKAPEKEFLLQPGESKVLKLRGKVPDLKGEAYGTLLIRSIPLDSRLYEIRIKSQVRLQVAGTEVTDVAFSGVSARRENGRLFVEAYLKNIGNMQLVPKMVVELEGLKGKGRRSLVMETGKPAYYPNELASFTGTLPLESAAAKHQRIFVTAFYHGADGKLQKKTQSFIVEAGQ